MCPVRALKCYLDRTRDVRRVRQRFVCFARQAEGKPAAKATFAGWIVRMIKFAYHDLDKECPSGLPHALQMRAVASSWAELASCELSEILRTGMWASSSTFVHHYRLDILPNQQAGFSSHVLSAAASSVDRIE